MRGNRVLISLLLVLTAICRAASASVDDARRLYQDGRIDAALNELESILGSEAPDAEKAEALDLVGTIAVDQDRLPMARDAWQRLVDEYPGFVDRTGARTKLALVSALLKEGGPASRVAEQAPPEGRDTAAAVEAVEAPAEKPPESTAQPAAAPAVEPVPSPAADPVPSPAADPAPSPAAEPAPQAVPVVPEPAPTATPRPTSGLVLVAGRGRPHDAIKEATDRVVEFLRERGVDAASATEGIPVVRESETVLPLLLQKGRDEGATSMLLMTAEFSSRQRMAMDCYTPEGAELWRFKVSGGTGWTGRRDAPSGLNEKLLVRFTDKLAEKVGGPGLPVTSR